jgi:flagellar motor switch protein FliN/FliY
MANENAVMSQDEIEQLFSQPKEAGAKPPADSPDALAGSGAPDAAREPMASSPAEIAERPSSATATRTAPPPPAHEPDIAAQDIEFLLSQAEKALESVNSNRLDDVPSGVSSYRLPEFTPAAPSTEAATLDLIRDVELDLKIELGRTHMYLEDVLRLRKGSVVPLDKMAGDPVDIYVNGRLIARGEVLVLNDNFCVRVAELIVGANVLT